MKKKESKKVDIMLVRDILTRVLVRNERDPITRARDRVRMDKNMDNLGTEPQLHLAFALKVVDQATIHKRMASFEAGLILGVTLVLCSQTAENRKLLQRMLDDIKAQQLSEPEINAASGAV